MDGTQVGVLHDPNQICLRRLLYSQNGVRLEAQIALEVLSNLANQTPKRLLAKEEISSLLVLADLTESDGARTESVGFLDPTAGRSALACGFRSKSLSVLIARARK